MEPSWLRQARSAEEFFDTREQSFSAHRRYRASLARLYELSLPFVSEAKLQSLPRLCKIRSRIASLGYADKEGFVADLTEATEEILADLNSKAQADLYNQVAHCRSLVDGLQVRGPRDVHKGHELFSRDITSRGVRGEPRYGDPKLVGVFRTRTDAVLMQRWQVLHDALTLPEEATPGTRNWTPFALDAVLGKGAQLERSLAETRIHSVAAASNVQLVPTRLRLTRRCSRPNPREGDGERETDEPSSAAPKSEEVEPPQKKARVEVADEAPTANQTEAPCTSSKEK